VEDLRHVLGLFSRVQIEARIRGSSSMVVLLSLFCCCDFHVGGPDLPADPFSLEESPFKKLKEKTE